MMMRAAIGLRRSAMAARRGQRTSRRRLSTTSAKFPHDSDSYLVPGGGAHVRGPSEPALLDGTVWDVFTDTVGRFGSRDALKVCEGKDLISAFTYSELKSEADSLALGLAAWGLEKGDRLGVWLPNCTEWLLLQLATAKLGIVLVNVNPAYRVLELEHALNLVGCKMLVLTPQLARSNYLELISELCPELKTGIASGPLRSARVPTLESVVSIKPDRDTPAGVLQFSELMSQDPSQALSARVEAAPSTLRANENINIQFTSGTTGRPKGATLSHNNIVNNAYLVVSAQAITEEDRMCIPVPLYHCFGMVMGNLGAITKGACMVYPAEIFNPVDTLACIEANKCTTLYGVPAMFSAELNAPGFDSFDLSSLRTGIMAGSTCPIDTMQRVMRDMHMDQVTIAYGMTETSPVSWQSRVHDPFEKRCGTVGRVMPNTECKIVLEDGKTAEIGENGELWTRGYLVMAGGYYNNEEQTAEAIDRDGWIRTGDVGNIDSEGYLEICGRSKDVIIRGGENLFPKEIEDYLHSLPSVVMSEVIGVPDERYGEAICAFVVADTSLEEAAGGDHDEMAKCVREELASKISHQKIPKHIIFRESFDDVKTATNKHMKFKLRQIAADVLGIEGGK